MVLTHIDIILSRLYYLGGDEKAVDLETLTVSCFKTFPSKFSMERFAEYPRFDRVEKRMSDIEKKGLIFKEQTIHYKLTEKGVQWIESHPNIIELIDNQLSLIWVQLKLERYKRIYEKNQNRQK